MSNIIQIFIGIYITLVGFGKVAVSKNPEKNEAWLAKWGMLFKIMGPVLIIIGILLLIAKFG